MKPRFSLLKRTTSKLGLLVFIDLLGTSCFWKSNSTVEEQVERTYKTLISAFDIVFCESFPNDIRSSFDISIFADSICISERKKIANVMNQMVSFCQRFQMDLLLNCKIQSRIAIVRSSFFSLKVQNASNKSIIGSRFTSVSLCGGRGLIEAHEIQAGLPMGVYCKSELKKELDAERLKQLVPIKDDNSLYFLKNELSENAAIPNLPSETIELLSKNPRVKRSEIVNSIKDSVMNPKAIEKILPWLLVHLGIERRIIRKNA